MHLTEDVASMSEKPSASEESAQRLLGGRAWEDLLRRSEAGGARH